jgi:hypothetical protein
VCSSDLAFFLRKTGVDSPSEVYTSGVFETTRLYIVPRWQEEFAMFVREKALALNESLQTYANAMDLPSMQYGGRKYLEEIAMKPEVKLEATKKGDK